MKYPNSHIFVLRSSAGCSRRSVINNIEQSSMDWFRCRVCSDPGLKLNDGGVALDALQYSLYDPDLAIANVICGLGNLYIIWLDDLAAICFLVPNNPPC